MVTEVAYFQFYSSVLLIAKISLFILNLQAVRSPTIVPSTLPKY